MADICSSTASHYHWRSSARFARPNLPLIKIKRRQTPDSRRHFHPPPRRSRTTTSTPPFRSPPIPTLIVALSSTQTTTRHHSPIYIHNYGAPPHPPVSPGTPRWLNVEEIISWRWNQNGRESRAMYCVCRYKRPLNPNHNSVTLLYF